MASIPGVQFNITGASGSQGLLAPCPNWRAYVFPRGAYASAASTGTQITLDSTGVAARFKNNDWIQVGLDTSKIKKVTLVSSNKLVLPSNVTVAKGDRIFRIGSTQPSVSGGSATYIIPNSFVFQRDDDGSDRYTNSMVTADSNGAVFFYGGPAAFDILLQDANQANQGYMAAVPCGAVEGVSATLWSFFGATVTINSNFGVTGWATFGQSVTCNAAVGITGTLAVGSTVTLNANLGVTGNAVFSSTATFTGTSGNYTHTGLVTFNDPLTLSSTLGVTGSAVFSGSLIHNGKAIQAKWIKFTQPTTTLDATYLSMSAGWGAGSSAYVQLGSVDPTFRFSIGSTGAGIGASPTVTITMSGLTWSTGNAPYVMTTRWANLNAYPSDPGVNFSQVHNAGQTNAITLVYNGTPVAGNSYGCQVLLLGNWTS